MISTEDRTLTTRLREAGDVLGIRLLDHLILGESSLYSFADQGWPLWGDSESPVALAVDYPSEQITHVDTFRRFQDSYHKWWSTSETTEAYKIGNMMNSPCVAVTLAHHATCSQDYPLNVGTTAEPDGLSRVLLYPYWGRGRVRVRDEELYGYVEGVSVAGLYCYW